MKDVDLGVVPRRESPNGASPDRSRASQPAAGVPAVREARRQLRTVDRAVAEADLGDVDIAAEEAKLNRTAN